MPAQDEMSIDERRKYLKLMTSRYRQAKRKERSQFLTEMEQVTKLHRKHLIRLLNGKVCTASPVKGHGAVRMVWKWSA